MNTTKQLTRSAGRMHTQIDWLDGYHSFSFGHHHDPERMGFGPLRVVNDDRIAPSGGFPSHPHRDMEIVTIVLEGQLEHKDNMGNGRIIEAGDIQYMSAGTGVIHSEFNPSADRPVHLMQIWIEPSELGLEPRYADQRLASAELDTWHLLLSRDGREGSMAIHQDAELRSVTLATGASIDYVTKRVGRGLWLFVIEGEVHADGDTLATGDSLAVVDLDALTLKSVGESSAKVLLFDVPMGIVN